MVNFSQTFVVYHDCGNGYLDGTRKIVPKYRKCIAPTYYPFWKKPIDVRSGEETRAQLQPNKKVTKNHINRYMQYVDVFSRNSFTSDDFSDDSLTSDDESLANNASNTEQNLYSDDETETTTGETQTMKQKQLLEKTSSLMKILIPHKLIQYLTHKIQTTIMKQITKVYLLPCSYTFKN